MRWISAVWAVCGLAGLGAGLLFLVYLGQRRMIYFPERYEMEGALRQAAHLGLAPWTENGRFLGWKALHPSGRARGRLVVLHGNAGSALDRAHFVGVFQSPSCPAPVDVYLAEYPGYGPRGGDPSEGALVAGALEAARAARRDGPGPVILVGESLGSGVAAVAAGDDPAAVDGLLLVTPLASVAAVARRHYGVAPSWLLRDRYAADESLPRFPGPVGFLVAGRDEVVFADLGLSLYEARRGPKRLWVEEDAGHNTLDYDPALPRWGEMLSFLLAPVEPDTRSRPPGR